MTYEQCKPTPPGYKEDRDTMNKWLEKQKNTPPYGINTYCKWYFDDCLDWNSRNIGTKWSVSSTCLNNDGNRFTREVTRDTDFFKQLYSGGSPCPGCNRPMTVGKEA